MITELAISVAVTAAVPAYVMILSNRLGRARANAAALPVKDSAAGSHMRLAVSISGPLAPLLPGFAFSLKSLAEPVQVENSAARADRGLHAACRYSLISPRAEYSADPGGRDGEGDDSRVVVWCT